MLFVFRTRETAAGCGFSALYLFGIWIVTLVVSGAIFRGAGGTIDTIEMSMYFGILLGLCATAFAVPLLVSRELGFRLTSPKRFEREHRLQAQVVQKPDV